MKSSSGRCDTLTTTKSIYSLFIKKPKQGTPSTPSKETLRKTQPQKPIVNIQEITEVIKEIPSTKRPPTKDIIARIKKNIPYANEITCALIYLCKNHIMLSNNLVTLLTKYGKYAVEIAKALAYLNEKDIFLTQRNINAIAEAQALAMQMATAIAWFISHVNANIYVVSEILDALALTNQVDEVILAYALLDLSQIPFTKKTIEAVANSKDPVEFSLKVISLKKEGETITEPLITSLAKTHGKVSQLGNPTTHATLNKTESLNERSVGLIENYFLNTPSITNKMPNNPHTEQVRNEGNRYT